MVYVAIKRVNHSCFSGRKDELDDTQAQPGGKYLPAWKVWVKTARPFSLTAAVSPVLVGTAVAAYDGAFNMVRFLAALLAGLFLQIGANYFNEYYDYHYGLDPPGSFGSMTG